MHTTSILGLNFAFCRAQPSLQGHPIEDRMSVDTEGTHGMPSSRQSADVVRHLP